MDQAVARPAGFWIRVVAFVIDAIVIMLAQALLRVIAARRWGAERDVASLLCFLASDLAGYITGTMVDVSGGKLATQIPRLAWDEAAAAGVVELE